MPDLNCTTKERLDARPRHVRFWRLAAPLARIWARRKFNFTFDDVPKTDGACLVLCNHVTNFDPIFVGLALGQQAYFVAAENVLHKGRVSRLLMRYFCPIIHQKGTMGLRSAKEMQQTLKAGVSVVLFPEGNRTFNGVTMDIPPVTVKMAKKAGKLVCLRLEGGYLTQPRWGTTVRRGRLHCTCAGVYDATALSDMSDNELMEVIRRDLHEDAFARQDAIAQTEGAPVRFAGTHLARGLESALFACPQCERIGTLESDDEGIFCVADECGFHARFTPEGRFEGGRFATIAQWDAWQQACLRDKAAEALAQAGGEEAAGGIAPTVFAETTAPLFSDEVTVHLIDENHAVTRMVCGSLFAYPTHFAFCQKDGDTFATFAAPRTFTAADISGLAVFSRNTLVAHVGKPAQHCNITGDVGFNALKYLYLFRAMSDAD